MAYVNLPETVTAQIRSRRGETINLALPPTCTVGDLRAFFINDYHYPVNTCLLYNGSVAADNTYVNAYPYGSLLLATPDDVYSVGGGVSGNSSGSNMMAAYAPRYAQARHSSPLPPSQQSLSQQQQPPAPHQPAYRGTTRQAAAAAAAALPHQQQQVYYQPHAHTQLTSQPQSATPSPPAAPQAHRPSHTASPSASLHGGTQRYETHGTATTSRSPSRTSVQASPLQSTLAPPSLQTSTTTAAHRTPPAPVSLSSSAAEAAAAGAAAGGAPMHTTAGHTRSASRSGKEGVEGGSSATSDGKGRGGGANDSRSSSNSRRADVTGAGSNHYGYNSNNNNRYDDRDGAAVTVMGNRDDSRHHVAAVRTASPRPPSSSSSSSLSLSQQQQQQQQSLRRLRGDAGATCVTGSVAAAPAKTTTTSGPTTTHVRRRRHGDGDDAALSSTSSPPSQPLQRPASGRDVSTRSHSSRPQSGAQAVVSDAEQRGGGAGVAVSPATAAMATAATAATASQSTTPRPRLSLSIECVLPALRRRVHVTVGGDASVGDLLLAVVAAVPEVAGDATIVYQGKALPDTLDNRLFNLGIRDDTRVYIASGEYSNVDHVVLVELDDEVSDVAARMSQPLTAMERKGYYEALMRLLFRTDGLQSLEGAWKQRRKDTVKRITELQDQLHVDTS